MSPVSLSSPPGMQKLDSRPPNRRQVLHVGVAGVVGALCPTGSLFGAKDEFVQAIDAHTHFYDPTRPQGVPWPNDKDKVLYRPVLPAEFLKIASPHQVSATIVVEASPWVEDNQWLLDLAARERSIMGVVGRLDPALAEFPELLGRFAKDPLFRGLRIGHRQLKAGLDEPTFIKNLGLLVDADRELDVNGGPEMLVDIARLSRALPKLRIVINHAANVRIDGGPPPANWRDTLRDASAGAHVYCKVSALVEGTGRRNRDAPTDVDFYRPVLDILWNTFGEDRLIYGSNWPVSDRAAAYATVYGIVQSYFAAKGRGPLRKFLRENAIAAYKPPGRDKPPVE